MIITIKTSNQCNDAVIKACKKKSKVWTAERQETKQWRSQ